jgi:hypothetical protein
MRGATPTSGGNMSEQHARIAIDDIVESASAGVLRALEARDIASREFTQTNGFAASIHIFVGGWPGFEVGNVVGPRQASAHQ